MSLDAYSDPTTFHQNGIVDTVESYISGNSKFPLFIAGDSLEVLRQFPSDSIDCCITSPPYWQKWEYENGGIGQEPTYQQYIDSILAITEEIRRVLKPTGSFWFNIGDSYKNKSLLNIPWRISTQMMDSQGWILRNTVIWNKIKGNPDNTDDKLRNMYEPIFHFVKSKHYFYNVDPIRNPPTQTTVVGGKVVSATGVSGKKYRNQIADSKVLTEQEKQNAYSALDEMLDMMATGQISDFRMVIRGQQRTTHSDSEKMSGRAKELHDKGFYFLKYNPKGTKPGDIWDIVPEDTQKRDVRHYASYPLQLCEIPIKTTCPEGGIVLDPFCGTGTTMLAALSNGAKSIGIDISEEYIELSKDRIPTVSQNRGLSFSYLFDSL